MARRRDPDPHDDARRRGYWLLGIPLGAWLGLSAGWGLAGIWWGLCIGLALVAASLVAWLRFRGPAHAARELRR